MGAARRRRAEIAVRKAENAGADTRHRGIQPSTKINVETTLIPLGKQVSGPLARGVAYVTQGANRDRRRGTQYPRGVAAAPGEGRKSRVGKPATPWAQRPPMRGTTTRAVSTLRRIAAGQP